MVDHHTKKFKNKSPEEFYRENSLPASEAFFTSSKNRILVENAFLNKGIEIVNKTNSANKNMRSLGYSIPSAKNFGFGALCFTWRNVPNNAPLVFWYSGGGFAPFFKVTRGSQINLSTKKSLLEFYYSLSPDWKDVVRFNICENWLGEENYIPTSEELLKIDSIEELSINELPFHPPFEFYGVSDLEPLKYFTKCRSISIRSLNISEATIKDFAKKNQQIEIFFEGSVYNPKPNNLKNNLGF